MAARLKQGFNRWDNARHRRCGTLWAERFKSVGVERQPSAIEAVAVYLDRNGIRAGLVEHPKDDRFRGYTAAVAGNRLARKGLLSHREERHGADAPPGASGALTPVP